MNRPVITILKKTLCLFSLWLLILSPLSSMASPLAERSIYADSLASGWVDWSWADVDLAATSPVHSGTHAIAVTFSAWSGLYLHHAGVSTASYTHLRFYLHGGASGGQAVNLFAHRLEDTGEVSGPAVALPAPLAGQWIEVRIPLADLGVENGLLSALTWQDASGSSQPTLYFDDIALVSEESPDSPQLSAGSLRPRALPADGVTHALAQVQVSDPQGLGDIQLVSLDTASLGLGLLPLRDDGGNGDAAPGDGVFGAAFALPPGTPPGEYPLVIRAVDSAGHQAMLDLGVLLALQTAGGNLPASLPQRIAWGSNALDWQSAGSVDWDLAYQYITYDWYINGWGGDFVQRYVNNAWDHAYIPVITVYLMLGVPPDCGEGGACYAQKLQNAQTVQSYLAALAQAAQEASGSQPVIFNLEPDFYGFMQQLSNSGSPPPGVLPDDPSSYPVALNLPGYPNNLAGFGRRMVDVVHAIAPNALVGPMASIWATNFDPQNVSAPQAQQMAQRTAAFMDAMGGAQADLLFVEWSDRDAGSGLRPWWDDADRELPRHTRAILWENALSAAAAKRLILWQVPVGNMSLDNTCDHYQDNRVAYAFSHPRDLFDAGVAAVLFGGGAACMTQPHTDGGFLAAQGQIAYALPAAPAGLESGPPDGSMVPLRWQPSGDPDLWGYRVTMQPVSGGPQHGLDASRRNSLELQLPFPGLWNIWVQAYDAMGQYSPPSAVVQVMAGGEPLYLHLPRVVR